VTPRLPIPTARVLLISQAAEVCRATVDRYRHGLPLRRAQERAIERAVREMPEEAQMSLDSLAYRVSDKPASSRNLTARNHCVVSKIAHGQTEPPKPRRRLTILDEHGAVMAIE